ncbi:MAG: hypothetical protein RRX95_04810 [Oscillospiraceae bacterium]
MTEWRAVTVFGMKNKAHKKTPRLVQVPFIYLLGLAKWDFAVRALYYKYISIIDSEKFMPTSQKVYANVTERLC